MKRAAVKLNLILTLLLLFLSAVSTFARDYSVFDVVGDSISAGVNAECGQLYGWVDMLFCETGCDHEAESDTITNLFAGITVYNSAISGSTARDWASLQPSYLAAVSNHHSDLVVVFIGGNDGLAYAAAGEYGEAQKAEFRSNLVTIVHKIRRFTPAPDIVLVDYYDLFDGFSTNLPAVYSNFWLLSRATVEGNRVISEVAESNGCFFVDIHSPFLHHAYGGSLGDTQHLSPDYVRTPLTSFNIHPVTAGHECIYEQVWQRLLDLKDIPRQTGIRQEGGSVTVGWSSSIGQDYVVERADTPEGPYIPLATNAGSPTGNVFTNQVSGSTAVYRIRVP